LRRKEIRKTQLLLDLTEVQFLVDSVTLVLHILVILQNCADAAGKPGRVFHFAVEPKRIGA
jgi:polyphosphate kinase 2 (PPK2 family)